MKKKNMFLGGVLAATTALLGACMSAPVSLAPSSSYIGPHDTITRIGPASGSSWVFCIFGLCPGDFKLVGTAVDRAVASSGGDSLIDVRMDFHGYDLLIGQLYQTSVYGTAVKVHQGGGN